MKGDVGKQSCPVVQVSFSGKEASVNALFLLRQAGEGEVKSFS